MTLSKLCEPKGEPNVMLRLFVAAVAVLACSGAVAAPTDNFDKTDRGKLAEMMAFMRTASDTCADLVSENDTMNILALFIAVEPPITEDEVTSEQKAVSEYRTRLGVNNWCQLYAARIYEAKMLAKIATPQSR